MLLIQEKLRRKASTSLYEFTAQAWHVIEPATPFRDNWHVGATCEHLEAVHHGQIRRLLINIPPRFLKSTTVSVMYPAWTWIDRPAHKFLTGSYALKLAIRDSLKMRRLIQSPWYRERWGRGFNLSDNSDWGDPDGFELTNDQNQKMRFENDRSGYRIAFGFEGGVMGEGGDDVIIDDPHDRESAHSDLQRNGDIVTYREAITTRLNDPAKSAITIVMQRLHEHDLSGYVLAEGGYEHLILPMHYDPKRSKVTCIGWRDPRTTAGELLHPDRFTPEVTAEWEKSLGTAAAGQLEQTPNPAEGGIIKRHWFRFYDELPLTFDVEIQSWDLAFKGTETANFTAGQAWGKVGPNVYKKPGEVYKQLDFVDACDAFEQYSKDHPYATKLVEDKANGPALMSTMKRRISGIIPVEPTGGAEAVAKAVAPYIQAGNVWLLNPYYATPDADGHVNPNSSKRTDPESAATLRLIENAAKFPNGSIPAGSHGDDVVAMTQAINHLLNSREENGGALRSFYKSITSPGADQ